MKVLDELEREIERVAVAAGTVRRRRRWARSSALLGLLPLGAATVAFAATTGILTGKPVENPPGLKLDPKRGLGVLVGPGTLLGARAQDPAGGPPWALRLVKTSRGLACVQLGRLVDGKLGVLGRDGAFGDDGRFHERGAEVLAQSDCQSPDAAGHVFIAMTYVGLPDSGNAGGCRAQADAKAPAPVCPPGSLREIFYGLLGPQGKAVTYADADGRVRHVAASGPEGAYVVVRPIAAERRDGYVAPGVTPAGGLRSVEYRDGSTCRIRAPRRPGGACPLKGYVAPKLVPATHAELASAIHVTVGRRRAHPGPDGAHFLAQRRISFSFRARRAADMRSFYTYSTAPQGGGAGCAFRTFGPIAKDVGAGAVVRQTLYVPYRCHGTLTIDVGYVQQRKPTGMPFMATGFGNAKVGSARVTLP